MPERISLGCDVHLMFLLPYHLESPTMFQAHVDAMRERARAIVMCLIWALFMRRFCFFF
jgi:hypothetical protein